MHYAHDKILSKYVRDKLKKHLAFKWYIKERAP